MNSLGFANPLYLALYLLFSRRTWEFFWFFFALPVTAHFICIFANDYKK